MRNEIEDYKQTVNAILAFAAFVVYDGASQRPDSQFGFGRRMTTSPANFISPKNKITPDLTAQKTKKYGIVAEAKKTIDRNQDHWKCHVDQLRKYDDELEGWWTDSQKIEHFNSLILIHQSRGRAFADYHRICKENNQDSVGSRTCIIEFNENRESAPFYFFRIEHGSIADEELKSKLYEGVNIPLDDVRMSFSNIQYYDAKPPAPLLLERLWTDVFPSEMDDVEYDEKTKSYPLKINVSEVTYELQKAYGSKALYCDNRSSEFPKQTWVKEALEQLVDYKLAKPDSEQDSYIIYFRKLKDDVLGHFINLSIAKGQKKQEERRPKQMTLF